MIRVVKYVYISNKTQQVMNIKWIKIFFETM